MKEHFSFLPIRDHIPKTLKWWDKFLFDKWSHGLYEFSCVVAQEMIRSDIRYMWLPEQARLPKSLRGDRNEKLKQLREMIKKLERLKKRTVRVFAEYLQLDGLISNGRINDQEDKSIIKLHPEIFRRIEEAEDDCRERLTKHGFWSPGLVWIKKGHHTDTKNRIAFIFAHVIKKRNGQPDWHVITELLCWFWRQFKGAAYRDELDESNSEDPIYITEKILSNAYSKAIRNAEKILDIEGYAGDYFSSSKSGYGVSIRFKKSDIVIGPRIPLGIHYPVVIFPGRKILEEKMWRKRYFQEGRSWDRKLSRLKYDWIASQRAAKKECELDLKEIPTFRF